MKIKIKFIYFIFFFRILNSMQKKEEWFQSYFLDNKNEEEIKNNKIAFINKNKDLVKIEETKNIAHLPKDKVVPGDIKNVIRYNYYYLENNFIYKSSIGERCKYDPKVNIIAKLP